MTTGWRKTGLAVLTAAALFGAGQAVLNPSHVGAQTPTPISATPIPSGVPAAGGPATLSATGIGQVPGDAVVSTGGALNMSIEERSKGTDVQGAVKVVQERIAKVRAALIAAGVPSSAIVVQGFNVGPSYGYAYPPMLAVDPAATGGAAGGSAGAPTPSIAPMRPLPPPIPTEYQVNAQLMVDANSPEQLATAMRVAIENGATNVNSYTKGGPGNPTPPDAAKLAPAIKQATEQANAMAKASAQAAGVTLGDISSIAVLTPTPSYGGGPGPVPTVAWQVQVRVTYALK